MTNSKVIALFSLIVFSSMVMAADNVPPPPSMDKSKTNTTVNNKTKREKIPVLPNEADDSRNIPQPEVRIIKKKDTVIEEYRVNGKIRYIKITPRSGPAYYMVDKDGDGVVETRENDLDNPPINQWILLEW